jgi:hypothetical protein
MRPFCISRHCTQIQYLVISTVCMVYVLYNYLKVNFHAKTIMMDEPQSSEQVRFIQATYHY